VHPRLEPRRRDRQPELQLELAVGASVIPRRAWRARRPARQARLALLVLALAPAVAAGEAPLADRRVLVEVGGRAVAVDYAEHGANGVFLDGETGIAPALAGAVEVRAGPASLRASLAVGGASLRYAGHAQSGSAQLNGLPIASTSASHRVDADAELAVAIPYARGLAVVAAAGRRRWDRGIHGTSVVSRTGVAVAVGGLSERYAWDVVGAGLRVPLVAADRIAWDADARITRTLGPAVTIATGGGEVRLPLGARWGYAVGSTVRAALARGVVARLGFQLERWEFGESGVDRSGWWEPRSTTSTATYELGVGVSF
jgi:hypothetical protein